MRFTIISLLGFALLGHAEEKPVLLNSDEIRYEGDSIKVASLRKAADNTSADMMLRWPAGLFEDGKSEPVSTHPFGFRIIVVEGTGLFQFEGGPLKELKPGAYVAAPPNAKHVLGCKEGLKPCLFFVTFSPAPK